MMTYKSQYNNETMRVPPISSSHNAASWRDDSCRDIYLHLPEDPRQWTRQHVEKWLTTMSNKHNINNIKMERFQMNGKALCLMTIDMYQNRVPLGGKMLYKDFQIRLARALYVQECNTVGQ